MMRDQWINTIMLLCRIRKKVYLQSNRPGWKSDRIRCASIGAVQAQKDADERAEGERQAKLEALELLGRSIELGFGDLEHIMRDPELDPLRQSADFKKLLKAIKP